MITHGKREDTVYHTLAFPVAALLAAAAGCLICIVGRTSRIALILALVFLVIAAWLLLVFRFWWIEYTGDSFTVHRLLRRRKTFSMWNIVGITESPGMTVIHLQGKKKVRIDAARGARQLVDAIEVHYRTVQKKGFALPDIPEKLFNGYLANPRDFLLAFGFVLFVEFSLVTGACVFLLKGVNMPDETFELAVNEFHTTIDDDMLYIQSPESQKQFVCPSFQRVLREKGQTAEDFLTEMAQQSVVTITGDEKRLQRTQTVFLTIYGLTGNDGKTILQYEDIKAGLLQNLLPWFYTAGGIVLYTVLFIAFICYVVAHAPRFPRLVRLLIKEEWLNI